MAVSARLQHQLPSLYSLLSLSTIPHLVSLSSSHPPNSHSLSMKLKPIRAQETTSSDQDTIFFESNDPEKYSTFDPPEAPDGYVPPPLFDDDPPEIENYGPTYSGVSLLGNDIFVMDSKVKKTWVLGKINKEKVRDGFDERVIQVRRVTKVVKDRKLWKLKHPNLHHTSTHLIKLSIHLISASFKIPNLKS